LDKAEMIEMKNNKLVVVLGMHRSGTSAITRGLQVMGVELGDKLMPPIEGNNPKGFWEDVDLNALNVEILSTINNDWYCLKPISLSDIQILNEKGYFERAIDLLRQKAEGRNIFGIKDPRISKLLPFWKEVFNYCQFDVSYVIALRHPLSVASSLAKRDGFEIEQSYFLWLSHVITSLTNSAGVNRVLVDYDRLMHSPDHELERIAKNTGLEIDSAKLESYKYDFLEHGLRHTVYDVNDLVNDSCPAIVREVYFSLLDVASEKTDLGEFESKIALWSDELERHTSPYLLIDRLITQRTVATQTVDECGVQIANFGVQIANLNQSVAERDGQITNLNQAVAERDGQIANLHQTIAEHNIQIVKLYQKLKIRNKQIADFYGSTSWRLTRPVRFVGRQIIRAKRIKNLALPAIKLGGGVTGTTIKALKLFRNEGLSGIKRGLNLVAKSRQPKPIPKKVFDESERNKYAEWIKRYDTLTDEARFTIRKQIGELPNKPLISVVMPVYNPKTEWLIEVIESVRAQIYPHWELCIADDASTDAAIRPILERYVKEDKRIKVVFRKKNGHISAASNSALKLAKAEWVALLDHDDLLSEHALFWVAEAICNNPGISLIYSDEDKIDESGNRFNPYFKPDWNVDLFYSHNLFSHFGVYRADILKAIGGFRVGFEGSQDYDLVLRCIERIEPKQIHHIPRVLYHWRVHAESTSNSIKAKPYAMLAGENAINEHFNRQKISAYVEQIGHGFRAHYNLPESPPLVSLIIPTRNGLELLRTCVESIVNKTTYPNYEIIIIDNGSDDPKVLQYFKDLQENKKIKVQRDNSPFNYSALNNAAVKLAQGEVIGLLNNDLEVISPEWLTEMVSIALQPTVGAVGAKLLFPNDTIQHGGVVLGLGPARVAGHAHYKANKQYFGYFGRTALISSFSAVSAACLVVRRAIYEDLGGLNEVDLQVAFNDVDFCLRVKEAGYRNVWTPFAELYHHESATRGFEDTEEKQERFAKEVQYMKDKWGELLLNDPAYSPNLTLDYGDFSYAWPPRLEVFGSLPDEPVKVLDRVQKALFMIDKNGLGLEIGPSHNPLAPKKQGFNVHVLDHASAEDLKAKYKGHDIVFDNIEEVDFVWKGEPLHESVGKEECYDWVIASHVIEHTPDMITFLQECERLLKPNGILSLVIPDKRYCFDYFNPVTWTGEFLDAYEQRRKRPSPGKVFDHFAGASKRGDHFAWGPSFSGTLSLMHDIDHARNLWEKARTTSDYMDVHNWRFTPSSFRLILSDLQALALTGLTVVKEFDTTGCEFHVTLQKMTLSKIADRLELLNAASIDGHGV
jgi:glycosyltransferase involved in cell wall biosynthesis